MEKGKGTYDEGTRNLISALLLSFPLTGCEKRSPRAELNPEICQDASNPLIYEHPKQGFLYIISVESSERTFFNE